LTEYYIEYSVLYRSTRMAHHISIHPAALADIPSLAAIRTEAAEPSLLTHFQFSPYHSIATEKESAALVTRLSKRFTDPDGQKFHLLKAVDSRNQETVGWALVKWEDGSWVNPAAPSGAHAGAPEQDVGPTHPESFGRYWAREVTARWRDITGGRPYVSECFLLLHASVRTGRLTSRALHQPSGR
jgi:hypothetical protein